MQKLKGRLEKLSNIPKHIGIIPDGNRRWAQERGMPKEKGYLPGMDGGLKFIDFCRELGVEEISIYGFTKENTKRPAVQVKEFREVCGMVGKALIHSGTSFLAVGDGNSNIFPDELRPYALKRSPGDIKVNLLVNYSWQWDLFAAIEEARRNPSITYSSAMNALGSRDVSRIDLVLRWGGRNRLSGFLPIQSAYADFFSLPSYWPDATMEEFISALEWYQKQDPTRGG